MQGVGLTMLAKVLAIYIAQRGEPPIAQSNARVEAHKGIVGDRYHRGDGTFSEKLIGNRKSEITFIASEEIDAFNANQDEVLNYGDVRRNVVTRGVVLSDLIGKQFSIGSSVFFGIEHCEPCAYLAETVNKKVLPHLVHTGLRAAIIQSGTISVDDDIIC